ncbi:MAG: MerR family transcriptional regulator [Lachnospiraceae bacterium]|nr:MerR family transcriptional regulator [Lachnospiraceae bacterium]
MKINQVEELVGITKKNIRFYEDEGLVSPDRNPENGYREYTLKDVEVLNKIKLLRMLDVSCEDIRRLEEGKVSLKECMEEHSTSLSRRKHDIDHMITMCGLLSSDEREFCDIKASDYLSKMVDLEKGGVRFMDVKKNDVAVRKTGAILAGCIVILFVLFFEGLMIWANIQDPMPIGLFAAFLIIPAVVVIAVLVVMIQRLKEIKGGEMDEAGKY